MIPKVHVEHVEIASVCRRAHCYPVTTLTVDPNIQFVKGEIDRRTVILLVGRFARRLQ